MVELKTAKNPLVAAAALCAALLYSGVFARFSRAPLVCMARAEDIETIRGTIASNPRKVSTRESYAAELRVSSVRSRGGGVFSCDGTVTAFIDAASVEAHHPGRLFTASKGKGELLCETGAIVELDGKLSDSGEIFFASKSRMAGWAPGFSGSLARFRALCRSRFRSLMAAWGAAGGLLLALVSGIREYTEADTGAAFRDAGLSHILALSGMHLSLMSGAALFAGEKSVGKKYACAFQAAALSLFVWFAGFSPSLLRAFICSLISLSCAALGAKKIDPLVSLCAAFLIQSAIAPSDVSSAAFMLSYGALAGIIITGEFFRRFFSPALPPRLASDFSSSCGAQVFTAPISLKLFGAFMPGGIVATVAVSPVVTVFIYCGVACAALCLLCPFMAGFAGIFLNAIYSVIKFLVKMFALLPCVRIR